MAGGARTQKPGLIARGVSAVKKFFGFGKKSTGGARGGKGKSASGGD